MSEMTESPVLLIIGTRPEGIKMAPVYHALKRAGIPTLICSTMQHTQLLNEVWELFEIQPDISLNIMRQGQDLFYVTQAVLQKMKEVFLSVHPSLVIVQGDTTSSMAASLAAFYLNIPVAHVEAGLRTDDVKLPFPEEMNRRMISMISTFHFAPTAAAVANLLAHGVRREQIFCTGNTIVDALAYIREKIQSKKVTITSDIHQRVQQAQQEGKQIGLLTVHRRESFNGPIDQILRTIKEWIAAHPETYWFYPFHPNPSVINAIRNAGLYEIDNLYMCEPINYKDLIYLLTAAHYVLTDSGGIQEEAVSLGKPVLVLREKTERMEGVLIGLARVVGCDPEAIKSGFEWVHNFKRSMHSSITQVYGDGHAAEKIAAFIQAQYDQVISSDNSAYSIVEEEIDCLEEKDPSVKKVCIIGLGYIGLPTAIVAAESGYEVVGYDIDIERVKKINAGDPIIHEPEAFEKLQYVIGTQQFYATTQIEASDFFVIAVPTPLTTTKTADLSAVYNALDALCTVLKRGDTIIIESTVPVGTTDQCARYIETKCGLKVGTDFYLAHCPERVLPGNIFYELIANDRIIGGANKTSIEPAEQFYSRFVSGHLYLTSATAAEMVKLIENSSRDVQLAFAHEVASMSLAKGLNPYEIIALANKHPRVNILSPSVGVGGHCLAVDPWFLVETFPQETGLIKTARLVNDNKPKEVIARIEQEIARWKRVNNSSGTLLLLGVSYKANIEDLRESPALLIAQTMLKKNETRILVADPHVEQDVMQSLFADSAIHLTKGIEQADIIAILVAHDRFKLIDRKLLSTKQVIDLCGVLYEPASLTKQEEIFWPAHSMMDFFIADKLREDGDTA